MESYDYLKFFIALIFVISLMGGLSLILKRFVPGNTPFKPSDKRRLKIIEALTLDQKRRAMIIRRDDKEHLIILGHNSETIVETNIDAKQENITE